MPQITLYIPDGPPQIYEVESYGFKEGRLYFSVVDGAGKINIATTVPYLIRTVEKNDKDDGEERVVTQHRSAPTRRGSQWG